MASAALLLLAAAACSPEEEPISWPTGTVVAIEGAPILGSEVDRYVDAIGAIDPSFSTTHRRRLALTAIGFPLAMGRQLGEGQRDQAREAAETWKAELEAGSLVGPLEPPLRGNWESIGLEVWVVARELEPGDWSEVVELSGHYAVVQLISRNGSSYQGLEVFEVQLKTFPYVPRPETLTELTQAGEVEIIDPEWDEIVPGYWKYPRRGDS